MDSQTSNRTRSRSTTPSVGRKTRRGITPTKTSRNKRRVTKGKVEQIRVRNSPNCGSSSHSSSKQCQHKNVECHKCSKEGHFAKLCRSSSNKSSTVDSVSTIHKLSKSTDIITVQVDVNGIPHRMELDTGCQRSVLGEDFWRKSLGAPSLQKSKYISNCHR
jgi:hypothetical protein